MRRYLTSQNLVRYALLLIAVLPLFIFRDVTRNNELRYLSIADEALRDGHFFTFYNHGIPYADKPPLYFWFVMLGKWLFGTHSVAFIGLLSVIPALVILRVMDKWVRPAVTSPSERLSAQLMLYTSVFFLGALAVLRMDMLMCMFIVLALYTFYRLYSGGDYPHRTRDQILFPVWIFLAVFSKGPVGILVPLVSVLVFLLIKRDWRKIGYYWGWRTWGILLLLSGLWFTGVYLEGGPEYLDNLVFNQTVNRAVDSFHHKEPFYYYGIAIWYSLAPWSPLIVGTILWGLFRQRQTLTADRERFILTVALSTFIMMSLVSSKIQIYLLPAFPFFVYITVLWIADAGARRWMNWAVGIPAALLALTLPGLFIAAPKVAFPLLASVWVPVGAGILSLAAVLSIVALCKGQLIRGINNLAMGMLLAIFLISFALPHFNPYLGMRAVTEAAQQAGEEQGIEEIYTYGIARTENLDVYTGRPIRILEPEDLEVFRTTRPAVLITRQKTLSRDTLLPQVIRGYEIHPVGEMAYIIMSE